MVDEAGNFVGSISESTILSLLIQSPDIKELPIQEIMEKPFRFVGFHDTIDVLASLIDKDNKALLVRDEVDRVHIITQADLLLAMTN